MSYIRSNTKTAISRARFRTPYRWGIGKEIKSIDWWDGTTFTGLNQGGFVMPICIPKAGTAFNKRVGNYITLKSLELTLTFYPSIPKDPAFPTDNVVSAFITPQFLRILIVYDKQTKGSLPTITDILQDEDAEDNTQTRADSGINLNNRDRFLILKDYRQMAPGFNIDDKSSFANAYFNGKDFQPQIHDFITTVEGLRMDFQGDDNDIDDVVSGSLLFVGISEYIFTDEVDQIWRVGSKFRLRYSDH